MIRTHESIFSTLGFCSFLGLLVAFGKFHKIDVNCFLNWAVFSLWRWNSLINVLEQVVFGLSGNFRAHKHLLLAQRELLTILRYRWVSFFKNPLERWLCHHERSGMNDCGVFGQGFVSIKVVMSTLRLKNWWYILT